MEDKIYYYFEDLNYPIKVTNDTTKLTQYTFLEDGKMWESDSIKNFYNLIDNKGNYNIIDIGAQSGSYSLFAKYLPLSTFYSFEPFPTSFKLLNDNIKLNEITNVKTFNLGLSNEIGITVLNTCISHNGLHTIGNKLNRFSDVKSININTTTIDNMFFERNIKVDFIKIDTEGHEYYILKGGIKTIKEYKPIIQLEWNLLNMDQCNVTEEMLNKLIDELGYIKKNLTGEELIIMSK